jgi:hypothetical protein
MRDDSETTTQLLRRLEMALLHRIATMPSAWCRINHKRIGCERSRNAALQRCQMDGAPDPCVSPSRPRRALAR